ncbi:thioredoxin domain-containing protein [Saccharomonospora sp. NPDC006951]
MGGAERTARKRRQEQQRSTGSQVVAKARGTKDTKKIIAVVVAVLVLAGVVIGGIVWTNASKNATEGQTIPAADGAAATHEYPERREGLVVVTGNPEAATTIDVYADFLCPVCRQFEQAYGDQIKQKVGEGVLQVRTHMVPMLVEASDPPGYSLDAANAALLAADEGKFTAFHDSLFANQPEEGKRGYDKEQLIQLGRDVGITSKAFADGVRAGTFDSQLTEEIKKIAADPALEQTFPNGQRGFGTPTVVSGGSIVSFSDEQWLNKLLANAQN